MFHDIMIDFICIGAYAIVILYGIRRTENRNMLPDPISCRGNVGMWTLDADIVRLEKDQPRGSKFMQRVSADLRTWMPEAKCFSPTNLKYMRRFFKLYCPAPIGQQVADRLPIQQFEGSFPNVARLIFSVPWGHHMVLILLKEVRTRISY